jgi:large repetitive protein
VLTGSRGEFSFPDLPAGVYFLEARRKGYAVTKHGQQDFDGPGAPIVLDEYGHFSGTLRLPRMGVVSGQVVDENQVGLPDVTVLAYRLIQTWKSVASARTDDRGHYRLTGLKPGKYRVRTSAATLQGGIGLMPTYFGGVVSVPEAQVVRVDLDAETPGIDISPLPGRLGRLSGSLVGAGAREVVLITGIGLRRTKVKPGGAFDFGQIEPGSYTLLVEPEATSGAIAALASVSMSEDNLRVSLGLEAAPVLTVNCTGPAAEPVDGTGVSIFLRRPGSGDNALRFFCDESKVWAPGEWEIAVATPSQYYTLGLLEAEVGDTAHRFRAVPAQETRVTVLLSDRPATLSGVVRLDGDPVIGAPVFLHAYDSELRQRSGGIRTINADRQGRYLFTGLPPGRYEVVSSYQIRDPDAEGLPPGLGTSVTLDEDEEGEQNLTLTVIR